ncbi:MAG: hypothetical protein LBK53_04755 [Heliobacteriaceae bacterium]|jgi:hypothetical protein|nr:hypothetical protein [Heliobacteriaceae bacterium]
MKKVIIILCLFITGLAVYSADLAGGVVFDWADIKQIERDTRIEQFRKILFEQDFTVERPSVKKDSRYKEHVMLVSDGITETDDVNLCAFYKGKFLYAYAVQYKNDPKKVYYYSLLGKLYYFDIMSGNYPNFPYTSRQYRANEKPVSVIYFVSHDMQYMYAPDGKFTGFWYKDKMFNSKGGQVLTRTNY